MSLIQTEIEKIADVISSLLFTMDEVGTVADEVEDKNLKIALYGLSDESCQYANELRLQLSTLGITFTKPVMPPRLDHQIIEEEGEGNELSGICKRNEAYLVSAYRKILAEYFPLPTLKEIMLYQMEALRCAFMKINILNAARFVKTDMQYSN